MHDIFISYSYKDVNVAKTICHKLEEANMRCWMAPRDIQPGQIWADAINTAIKGSKVFILIFSENSNNSNQVSKELTLAVNQRLMIFPFKITNTQPKGAFEYYLADTHWLDAINTPISQCVENMTKVLSFYLDSVPLNNNHSNIHSVNLQAIKIKSKDNIKKIIAKILKFVELAFLIFMCFLFVLFIYCFYTDEWKMLLPFYDLLKILGIAFLILLLIGLSKPQLLLYRKRSTIGWLFGLPLFLCAIIAGNAEEYINKSSSISFKSLNKGTDIENSTVNKILNNMIFIDSNLYVCKYELSSYEWECIMGEKLKFSEIGNYPARNITESDCHRFLVKIREISGIGFNIPTVEEWMRVVRDNYTTYYIYAGSNNVDEVAWYNGNSDSRVHPVGMKKPTKHGIFDLCGNVWEYCYSEDFGYCTVKGGGACSDSMYCMLTDSSGDSIYIEPFEIGMRLVINKSPIFDLPE